MKISPKKFLDALHEQHVDFFTGVPDSLLKDLLLCIEKHVPEQKRITAANEGNAIGIAAGYHLATGKIPAVYLQNSGIGNAINPLTSLTDPEVYGIPILLIIGWRGEPGFPDEPQHAKQGRITDKLLDTLEIPYVFLSSKVTERKFFTELKQLIEAAGKFGRPCAIIVQAGTFEAYSAPNYSIAPGSLGREEAIGLVLESIGREDIVVSTTGKISRELYELRKNRGEVFWRDFLTVGSMGHASQIALGIAHEKKRRTVYCLDGDGACLMHLGGLATIGWVAPRNYKHIVLDNMAYESVGGQRSAAEITNLTQVAKDCGYAFVATASSRKQLILLLKKFKKELGPCFLEIKVNLASRKDLGRPKETPAENKKEFMKFIAK